MSANRTAGPWKMTLGDYAVSAGPWHTREHELENGVAETLVHGIDGLPICRMGGNVTKANVRGNAALIARAPELLADNTKLRDAATNAIDYLENGCDWETARNVLRDALGAADHAGDYPERDIRGFE